MKTVVEIDYEPTTDYLYNLDYGDVFCLDQNIKGTVSHIFMMTDERSVVNLETGELWRDLEDFADQNLEDLEGEVWCPASVEIHVKMRGKR